MNTSAINSPANILQTPAPAGNKPETGSTADTGSFNQMLSREMSDRNNTANTNNNSQAPSSNEVSKPAQKDGNNSSKSESATNGKESAIADATKKTDDNKVASGKDVKEEDNDGDQTAATDAAGIAAFVAALTSAKATPAETAAATTTAPTAKITLTDAEIKAKNNTIDIAARIANSDAAAGDKEAIGKKSDFVSALDKATSNLGDSAKTAVASDAEVTAATAQAIKVLDAATGNTPQTINAVAAAAALQPRNDVAGVRSSELLPQVGTDGWDQALGQKVIWMAKGAEQTATLTLNPPDLGPMQITLNVSNNHATATFTAHQPEVRHALETSMPRLREMLNEAGIQLGQSNVSAGSPNQQGAGESRQGNRRAGQAVDTIDAAVHVSHVPVPAGDAGIVDTFA